MNTEILPKSINIYSWEGYSIYRALQGKKIPPISAWDYCRNGFGKDFYSWYPYWKFHLEEIFTPNSVRNFLDKHDKGITSYYPPFEGSGRAIEKADRTLGGTGEAINLFREVFTPNKSKLQSAVIAINTEYLLEKFNKSIGKGDLLYLINDIKSIYNFLINYEIVDSDFHYRNKPTISSEASIAWITFNRVLENYCKSHDSVTKEGLTEFNNKLKVSFKTYFEIRHSDFKQIDQGINRPFLKNYFWLLSTFSNSFSPYILKYFQTFKSKFPDLINVYYTSALNNDSTNITKKINSPTEIVVTSNKINVKNSSQQITGTEGIQKNVSANYRKTPIFEPSKALIPKGFTSTGNDIEDLKYAFNNPKTSFRSFFNDMPVINNGVWIEETLFTTPFNESLFSKLVHEYHRFSLTELRNQKEQLMKEAERKGAGVGGIAGLFSMLTGGIMSPFTAIAPLLGANVAKMAANNLDPKKPIQDFLPDPGLLFARDEGSFTSLRSAYNQPAVKRRICLRKVNKDDNIYWDLFPMIVFANSATPAQIFKWEDIYYMRPISAALFKTDAEKLGYNPIKYRRSYSYHPQLDIKTPTATFSTKIIGDTIEKEPMIFKASLREDKSFEHFYFDYPTDGQIF